ncbi:hypothetical protein ACFE04_017212 [Oxalis oulophora]
MMQLRSSVNDDELPRWLDTFLRQQFFRTCLIHQEEQKKQMNLFCLDCCISICPDCLPRHPSHRVIQIRRYVYHDVIRLDDANQLIDCSDIQSYISNSTKVVFIHKRPPQRKQPGVGKSCHTCNRFMHNSSSLFCCFYCKVNYLFQSSRRCELSKELVFNSKLSTLTEPDGLITSESTESIKSSSSSSISDEYISVPVDFVRKKRTSLTKSRRPVKSPESESSGNLMANRRLRKMTPHRAPLY